MHTEPAQRIEIVIESPLQERLCRALDRAGVTGYTVLPVLGGRGRSGSWTREGQVSLAAGMVTVLCITRKERADAVLEAAFAVLETHRGVVSVSECSVVRDERF